MESVGGIERASWGEIGIADVDDEESRFVAKWKTAC